jgi:hypothetical protein
MVRSDTGFRWWEPYVELTDPPLWRAETAEQIHRLLSTPMSVAGRWERLSAELVHRARATSFWSAGALAAARDQLVIDRVVDFRIVLPLLLEHPSAAASIIDHLAVGCVVTQQEAQVLGRDRPATAGWGAYEVAQLRVQDREAWTTLDVAAAARGQRELLRRLGAAPEAPSPPSTPSAWPPPSPPQWGAGTRVPPTDGSTVVYAAASPNPPPRQRSLPPRAPSMRMTETFVPVLRALVGQQATITDGPNWISASGERESITVTFHRTGAPASVVVAEIHHDDRVEAHAKEVVRHVTPEELDAATTTAMVRAQAEARREAEVRREEEEVRSSRSTRLEAMQQAEALRASAS